jgi:hypothetical protein
MRIRRSVVASVALAGAPVGVSQPAPGRYAVAHDLLRACATELTQTVDSDIDRVTAIAGYAGKLIVSTAADELWWRDATG